jgi:hypothetical protein
MAASSDRQGEAEQATETEGYLTSTAMLAEWAENSGA